MFTPFAVGGAPPWWGAFVFGLFGSSFGDFPHQFGQLALQILGFKKVGFNGAFVGAVVFGKKANGFGTDHFQEAGRSQEGGGGVGGVVHVVYSVGGVFPHYLPLIIDGLGLCVNI